jgi:sacsin
MGFEDDGGDADEVWSDFGQKVDLTARLREILLNYPEGTSILKELVQNAVSYSQTSNTTQWI